MNYNKIIVIIFSFICVIFSTGMFLLSREDIHLAYGALFYFVISIFLLWITYIFFQKKQFAHKTVWFTAAAICITSTVFPIFWVTERISEARDAVFMANFRNTQVTDFHDEILFSEKNNPIGIRLSYTVIVPQTGLYFPEPAISFENKSVGNLYFYLSGGKIDPLPKLERQGISLIAEYKAGVSYRIVADLTPSFLLLDQKTGNLCVNFYTWGEENLIKNSKPQRLEIDIDGTSFNRFYGQGVKYLENNYNLKDFYDSIAKENISSCAKQN